MILTAGFRERKSRRNINVYWKAAICPFNPMNTICSEQVIKCELIINYSAVDVLFHTIYGNESAPEILPGLLIMAE